MDNKKELIIDIENVSKSFAGQKVLNNISLHIKKGEFVTFLGPSGCGKTTMLRIIAGFLQPDEGSIIMEGKEISDTPPYLRPLNTVFQRYALFPHLDVYDNVAFGLKLINTPENEIEKRVKRVLRIVGMADYEDRDVESLSGGQQQRVAIARAIINRPKVLLLDEPLAALDLKMRKDMQIELKEMHAKLGITFIYVTHDQEEALTLSDTVVVMNEGQIQQIGSPKDIYNEPVNSFVADFIGESNILNGQMIKDHSVSFIGKKFQCIDAGFGENMPVDVVIRPEDIHISNNNIEEMQFRGTVTSCTFKGVHYEMYVNTDNGFELQIQNYFAFEEGTEVGMSIRPEDIQVMKKERNCNTFSGVMEATDKVSIIGGTFSCRNINSPIGKKVTVTVDFDKVELLDEPENGILEGEVHFILYKGNHYHLTIRTTEGFDIYVDTNDVWDKGDKVGINIASKNLNIREEDENN